MLPVQKISRAKTRSGRAHKYKTPSNYTYCPNCSKPKLPHAACDNCGFVRPGLSLKVQKEK